MLFQVVLILCLPYLFYIYILLRKDSTMAEVKLEERIVLASSFLSCLPSHLLQRHLCLGNTPIPCLSSLGIPTESRTETRHKKSSGCKTQHHLYLYDHVGFCLLSSHGGIRGWAKPQRNPIKSKPRMPHAMHSLSNPLFACVLRSLQNTVAKTRNVFLCLLRKRQRSLCGGLVSVYAFQRVSSHL